MNCRPIVEAGQALLVDESYSLDDTFFLSMTPGHSPLHCCVHIRSKGQEAIVLGDMMHHALQCREPDWSTRLLLPTRSWPLRRAEILRAIRRHPTLMLPIHFPSRPRAVSRRTASASAIDFGGIGEMNIERRACTF